MLSISFPFKGSRYFTPFNGRNSLTFYNRGASICWITKQWQQKKQSAQPKRKAAYRRTNRSTSQCVNLPHQTLSQRGWQLLSRAGDATTLMSCPRQLSTAGLGNGQNQTGVRWKERRNTCISNTFYKYIGRGPTPYYENRNTHLLGRGSNTNRTGWNRYGMSQSKRAFAAEKMQLQ